MNNNPCIELNKVPNYIDKSVFGSHFVNASILHTSQDGALYSVVFSNNDAWNQYAGEAYAINLPCEICGRLFYDKPMIGIPIKTSYETLNGDNFLIIHMDGVFHSFECAFAALRQLQRNVFTVYQKNPLYGESESILRMLFDMCYPGEDIDKVIDSRPVSGYHGYTPSLPNIILMPLKTCDYTKRDPISKHG